MGTELADKTLGIIGLGNVGKKVAKRGLGFEMRLLGFDPFLDKREMAKYGVEKVDSLEDLLPKADFITLHVPPMDTIHHFFGERQLNMMKKTAILVNTSRGQVVDQKALVKALKKGIIGGAGLDVFEIEPPDDTELLSLENIVVSPHIAGTTHEALKKMTFQAAKIIIENLKG